MIGIFGGRGIHTETLYAQVSVAMRSKIHLFSNGKNINAFGVFMCIALHANKDGWSWPSRDTIMQETGISTTHAIADAVSLLRDLTIDGQRIMGHYRVREANGRWGKSAFLIFPDIPSDGRPPFDGLQLYAPQKCADTGSPPEEIEDDQPCADYPHVGQPHVVDQHLEVDPSLKEIKDQCVITQHEADASPPLMDGKERPEDNPSAKKRELTPDIYRSRLKDAEQRGFADAAARQALFHGVDVNAYPADVREVITVVSELWMLRPPRMSHTRGTRSGGWIRGARDLKDACAEFGVDALREARGRFVDYMRSHGGVAPFTVSGPFSLVNYVASVAGEMRSANLDKSASQSPPPASERWVGGQRVG